MNDTHIGYNEIMGTETARIGGKPARKTNYHHGQLRDALIEAAHRLIAEKGPEDFTLAEACRQAGVSTAAPYRHFSDRAALVQAVAQRGFAMLDERTRIARDSKDAGTPESIYTMGQAYVAFAADEPALFKLMFGRHFDPKAQGAVNESGFLCAQVLFEAVEAWIARHKIKHLSVHEVALPLWTLVHGTSYLLIDRDFDAISEEPVDTDALIERATIAMLKGLGG